MRYLKSVKINSYKWLCRGRFYEFLLLSSIYTWKKSWMSWNFSMIEEKLLRSATWNLNIVFIREEAVEDNNWCGSSKRPACCYCRVNHLIYKVLRFLSSLNHSLYICLNYIYFVIFLLVTWISRIEKPYVIDDHDWRAVQSTTFEIYLTVVFKIIISYHLIIILATCIYVWQQLIKVPF